jgi:hypothetical protein
MFLGEKKKRIYTTENLLHAEMPYYSAWITHNIIYDRGPYFTENISFLKDLPDKVYSRNSYSVMFITYYRAKHIYTP